VSVRNTGARSLRTVVFVHAGVDASAWERPPRRLVGFARATVAAGGTAEIEIEVDWSMLDVRAKGEWITESGRYVVEVGRYSGDPDAVTVHLDR
jgi:beta-glucosidase